MNKRKILVSIVLAALYVIPVKAYEGASFCKVLGIAGADTGNAAALLVTGTSPDDCSFALSMVNVSSGEWTSPEVIPSLSDYKPAGGCIWNTGQGLCVLASTGKGTFFTERTQAGWSSPSFICEGTISSAPVRYGDTWAMAVSDSVGVASIYRGNGSQWTLLGRVKVKSKRPLDCQPALFSDSVGRLSVVMRSVGYGWTYKSVFDGSAWSAPEKFLPAPDRKFALIQLLDGRLLAVKHGFLGQHLYNYPDNLHIYMSDDGGDTWYGGLRISEGYDSKEPVAVNIPGGGIITAYNINRPGLSEIRSAIVSAAAIDASTASIKSALSEIPCVLSADGAVKDFKARSKEKKKFAKTPLRVASFNIQLENSSWPKRLEVVKSMFDNYKFDVVGSQEPNAKQLSQMMELLGDEYAWVGGVKGDEDRKTLFNPVFYRKSRVELLDWDTIWYTDVPETPGYGAFTPRMCIKVKFRDKTSGIEFYVFNSHFDHRGTEAKKVSALTLIEAARDLSAEYPVFFTGDYNDTEDSFSYKTITTCGLISDSMTAVKDPVNAELSSTGDYQILSYVPRNGKHIDHLYYTPERISILSWELVTYNIAEQFASDHFPVMIDCKLAL